NLVPAAAMPFTSLTRHIYDSGDHPKALVTALDAIGYAEFAAERDLAAAQGRLVGIGFACYVEYHAIHSHAFPGRGLHPIPGFDSAHVAWRSDGVVHLWTTLPAIGQGTETTFAQLAADAFGIPYTGVVVHKVDTGVGKLEGTGVFASRSATSGGGAIISACGELRRRGIAGAAGLLQAGGVALGLIRDGRPNPGAPHRSRPPPQ